MEKKVCSMAVGDRCFLFLMSLLAAAVLQSQTIQSRQCLNTDIDHHQVEEEADTELEMQLHKLNKPPIKTIQSRSGELFDCIDVYKQPALDHPLLKNHTLQLRPSSFPIAMSLGKIRSATDYAYNESCPEGTVLIKRIYRQDLIAHKSLNKYVRHPSPRKYNTTDSSKEEQNHFATMQCRQALYHGGHAQMVVYGVADVGIDQVSQSSIYVFGGFDQARELLNTINAGWHDPVSSNWLVTYGDNEQQIGYFPKELFNNNFDISDKVHFGGQVLSPLDQPCPPMGSGHRWGEGDNRTAYFMNVQVISPTNHFYTPESSTVNGYTDIPAFYSVGARSVTEHYGFKFAYGGPGGYKK